MAAYRLTKPAESDLFGIWNHIAGDDPRAADSVLGYLHERCLALASSPGIGRLRKDFGLDLHVLSAGKRSWRSGYLIFYRPSEGGIDVIRVLEGHRNLSSDFFAEP